MSPVAHEFNISVTPLKAQDEYLVRREWGAPGVPVAQEQVRWPVDDWLAIAAQLMNDPLSELLQAAPSRTGNGDWLGNSSSPNLVALGQELHDALFKDSLRDSWMIAQALAERDRSVLRLRLGLGLKDTRLLRLPWEVLHADDRPLATGTDVAFSRYELTTGLRTPTSTLSGDRNQPLKILMAIAGPTDQETLALKQEASHLQEELRRHSSQNSPTIELELLEQPGREQLTQALEQGQYNVFHYAGHSNLGVSGGDLYLVSGRTGLTETLSGDDLAGLLVNNGVQMAVFNSCRGAYTASGSDADTGREQNLIQALVKRRIPSVLAMAERIPDEVALTLTRLFYRNLKEGYPIDLSLSRARQGLISSYGSNNLYWALPVLYLDSKFDGLLTRSNDPAELAKRLALPDPSEAVAAWDEEVPEESPALAASRFLDYDDDLGLLPEDDWVGYDDDAPPGFLDEGDDDAEALVADLFRQLPKPNAATEQSAAQASNLENRLPSGAESRNQNLKVPIQTPDAKSQSPKEETPGLENSKIKASGSLLGNSKSQKGWKRRVKGVPVVFMTLGALGLAAIALLGFWLLQNRDPQPDELLRRANLPASLSQSQVENSKNLNLKKAETNAVTGIAVDQFSRGDLNGGVVAVEELLNREALKPAEAALAAVPKQQLDNPKISFLRGRLAWQSVQTGAKDFSIDDARRYWELADKKQPNTGNYLNALGFAYYAEGKFDQAIKVWFEALSKVEDKPAASTAGALSKKDALNTYAGLALALKQSAQKQPPDKRGTLLNASKKMSQKVMSDDPVNFQANALSKNWLWTEKAIKDWRSLQTAKG
jgi:hypothetical protein